MDVRPRQHEPIALAAHQLHPLGKVLGLIGVGVMFENGSQRYLVHPYVAQTQRSDDIVHNLPLSAARETQEKGVEGAYIWWSGRCA